MEIEVGARWSSEKYADFFCFFVSITAGRFSTLEVITLPLTALPGCRMGSLRSNLTLALVCLLIHVLAASALKGVPKKSDKCPEQFPNEAICLGPESDSASGCFAELAVSCCGCMASTCYGCPNSATCATELGETCKKGIWSPRACSFKPLRLLRPSILSTTLLSSFSLLTFRIHCSF